MKFVAILRFFGLKQDKMYVDAYQVSLHVYRDMYHIT